MVSQEPEGAAVQIRELDAKNKHSISVGYLGQPKYSAGCRRFPLTVLQQRSRSGAADSYVHVPCGYGAIKSMSCGPEPS